MAANVSGIMVTSSARKRYDLATKYGDSGRWISQGSYPTLEAAQKRGDQWLKLATPKGSEYRISDEIGNEVYHKP